MGSDPAGLTPCCCRAALAISIIGAAPPTTFSPSPVTFRIEQTAETAADYAYILEPRSRILRAAIETGTTVRPMPSLLRGQLSTASQQMRLCQGALRVLDFVQLSEPGAPVAASVSGAPISSAS
jgi:hypothetical protein